MKPLKYTEVSLTLTAYIELCVVVHNRGAGQFAQAFWCPFIHHQTQGLILDQHLHHVEKTIIHGLHTGRKQKTDKNINLLHLYNLIIILYLYNTVVVYKCIIILMHL